MASDRVCWGIPGGGKTTFGIGLANAWMKTTSPDMVAYLAFTRAAARTAAYRIRGGEEDFDRFPLFRTVHSLCYRGLLRANPDARVVTTGDLKQFAKETGLDGAYTVYDWEDLSDVYARLENQGRTEWDRALTAYSLSRVVATSAVDLERARHTPAPFALSSVGMLEDAVYEAFVQKYEEFKKRDGLVDFTDMLEWGLLRMPPVMAKYAIIDEAQDLCPIIYSIIDRLFSGVEERWWIGDDDQALYKFSGATADLFLAQAQRARFQVELRKTRRYGQEVVDFSRQIIRRVSNRHEKDIVGAMGNSGRITLAGQFAPVTGNIFVLHRHVAGCRALGDAYIQAGIPFRNERGKSPLESGNKIKAWTALRMLSSGAKAAVGQLRVLIDEHLPSIQKDDKRTRLVASGAKKRLGDFDENGHAMSLVDLVQSKILTEEGASVLKQKDYDTLVHAENFEYYDRVVANGYELEAEKVPIITTIHGSKGREAEGVVVMSEMGSRCWEDPDTEHRVAYVAATRTRGDVTICTDDLVDWAATRYDYPVGQKEAVCR